MWLFRVAALLLAISLSALPAAAQYPPPPGAVQYPPPPPGSAPPPPPGAVAALYSPPQLDQMLAPIALYPDPLLTEILTAATYPLEVVDAARWRQYPQNAALMDGALASAVEAQDWDPSVKSLAAFPQVLAMMNQHLDWTQAIGNAFLAQQGDVMDSIQRLRHDALAAGTLVSSPYATVVPDGPYIEIEPANPELLYVPVYNPAAVYGAWPYPTYQPYYFGPPPGLSANFAVGALGFSLGIGLVDVLWNWGDWDWRDHNVHIDRNRFARLEPNRAPPPAATWQHDPAHRRGVPYRDAQSRAAYQRPVAATPPETRQQFRFYPQQTAPAPQQRAVGAPQGRGAQRPEAQRPGQQPPQQPQAPRQAPQGAAAPQERRAAPQPQAQPQAQRTPPPAVVRPPLAPAQAQRPTAFPSISRGPDARAEAQRGAASRQSRPAPAPIQPQAARPATPPPARAAPAAPPRPAPPQGNLREERRP